MKTTGFGETEDINKNLVRTNARIGKRDKAVNSLINPINVDSGVVDSHPMNIEETFTKGNELIVVHI